MNQLRNNKAMETIILLVNKIIEDYSSTLKVVAEINYLSQNNGNSCLNNEHEETEDDNHRKSKKRR